MEPVTKTYKGIEMTFVKKRHGSQESKYNVSFVLNGSTYNNGTVLSKVATEEQIEKAIGELYAWGQSVINDHTKK